MPAADDRIDLEELLRDAVSGVAVAAYARGIGLSALIDNRLPDRVTGDADAVRGFLRRGLSRMIDTGQTRRIAVAFWLEEEEGGAGRVLLESCRAVEPGRRPSVRLADLWSLPIGAANARPIASAQPNGAECALIPLPCTAQPGAPPIARRWGTTFRGRRLLFARERLLDAGRVARSMAAIGLTVDFRGSAAAALDLARRCADAGEPFDMLVADSTLGNDLDADASEGGGAVAVARAVRADPRLAEMRIMLWHVFRRPALTDEEAALFDAIQGGAKPWRRLMDAVHDLARDLPGGGEAAPEEVRAAAALPSLAGRRILIAEDVASNQVLLRAMLQPTGAEVEIVADGAALLARHAEAPADLILMDLQMPGMGGIAAMRRLRALGGESGKVPVIALTAYARRADRKRALDAGIDAYLVKPVVVPEFYELLRRLLPEGGTTREG